MKLTFTALLIIVFLTGLNAQTDSLKVVQPDTTLQEPAEGGEKDKAKRKDEFILYTGVTLNQLSVSSETYESSIYPGFLLGGAYKRGKFVYWQAGVRYNNAGYNLKDANNGADTTDADNIFGVRDIDIPLNVGINLLSATNRVMALRIFIGAIPAFTMGVGDNDVGITKDDLTSFNLYGQGGIGVNVAFMVLEAGYNYGFTDLFGDDVQSKPGQIFVNIGFRF
jgi:hypothetical protein